MLQNVIIIVIFMASFFFGHKIGFNAGYDKAVDDVNLLIKEGDE